MNGYKKIAVGALAVGLMVRGMKYAISAMRGRTEVGLGDILYDRVLEGPGVHLNTTRKRDVGLGLADDVYIENVPENRLGVHLQTDPPHIFDQFEIELPFPFVDIHGNLIG